MKLLFAEYGGLLVDSGTNRAVVALLSQLQHSMTIDLVSVCAGANDAQTPLPDGTNYEVLLKGERRIRQTLPAFKPLLALLRKNRYDYIVIHCNGCAPAVLPAALVTGTKVIYMDHAVLNPDDKRNYFYWERKLESRVCRAVLTLTRSSRQTYIREFRLPEEQVYVMHNIVPPYGGPLCTPDRTELVSVLRFAPEKGPELIADIAAALKRRTGHFIWRIWGSGIMENRVRESLEKAGVTNEVILMGTSSDKDELYRSAGALVMTSRYEGWGLAAAEAKSRGIPVFAFDVPFGPGELIRDGINGALVKPWDCDEMAERLSVYLRDALLRESMISHAREGLESCTGEAVEKCWTDMLNHLSGDKK